MNHRLPDYTDVKPYVPPHANIQTVENEKRCMNYTPYVKPMVFKEQMSQKPLNFTVDVAPVQSKVFDRLFPCKDTSKVMPSRNFHLNLNKPDEKPMQKPSKSNARSIFKNYKSCPVSPVSEECKWADKVPQGQYDTEKQQTNSLDPKKRNSLSFFVGLGKRDLKDSGKSIVDTIKSDTEKMIAEITKKYGDLDEYEPNIQSDLDLQPSKEVAEMKEDGNFSSDSLEDCSLSQDVSCKNKLYSKKICKKHNRASVPRRTVSNYEIYGGAFDKPVVPVKPANLSQKSSTLPRNMPSNIEEVVENNINCNMYRCQSVLTKRCVTRSNESVLSDNSNCSSVSNEIFLKYGNEVAFQQAKFDSRYHLNDSQNCSYENINDDDYLDNHRHSSASFFLNQKKYMKSSCSQESVLSDDMFLENDNQLSRTNCNSLESVLSDDSECTKSAPLEMLFEGARPKTTQKNQFIPRNSKSCYEFDNGSKSYGSSPNNAPYFGGYMYNNYIGESTSPNYREQINPVQNVVVNPRPPTNKVYGFDIPISEKAVHKTVTRSKSLYDSTNKQASSAKNIAYYFDGNNVQQYTKEMKPSDEIPRLNRADYMANTTKSLQPNFTEKQKYKTDLSGNEKNTMIKSKSCSFEVVLEPASKPNPLKNLMEKRNSHVQKNLEKFEEQIKKNNTQSKITKNQLNKDKVNGSKSQNTTKSLERSSGQKNNNKITMEFVPHKPPKPMKRTSSVKVNNKVKASLDKSTLSSSISSQYKAKLDGLQNKNYLTGPKQEDNNFNKVDTTDNTEKSFDIYVKEKDVNENKSEMQMDSLEVYAMQEAERMEQVSMDSLDVLEDFAKDSLDYYAEQENRFTFGKCIKDRINLKMAKNDTGPSQSSQVSKENIAPVEEEIKKYKYIERKIEIINKLVEMEERKILQEKILKEWRMKPLKANINDGKGVVKVLSRKFEKLATSQTSNFASLTLEEADTDADSGVENKEIKRNLSLPDILDSDQIGLVTGGEIECGNESVNTANNCTKLNNTVQTDIGPKSLKQRVYNDTIIPKTDVHLDSENYESSTTSSSCTNSPKRLSFYGFNRPKTPFRKILRAHAPRMGFDNNLFANNRPVVCSGAAMRGSCLAKKVLIPVLPSKFAPLQGRVCMSCETIF